MALFCAFACALASGVIFGVLDKRDIVTLMAYISEFLAQAVICNRYRRLQIFKEYTFFILYFVYIKTSWKKS